MIFGNKHKPPPQPLPDDVQWTLVGGVKSGKSYLVYSALYSLDVTYQDGAGVFSCSGETRKLLYERMTEHSRKGDLDSTGEDLIRYKIEYVVAGGVKAQTIQITDGPGRALHPEFSLLPGEPSSLAEEYRKEALGSDALLIFLPFPSLSRYHDVGFLDVVRHFVGSLQTSIHDKLRRIAVCISKVDAARGFESAVAMNNLDSFTEEVCVHADPGSIVLNALRNFNLRHPKVDIALFPVSSFGVVKGTGRRNLLPERGVALGRDLPLVNHMDVSSLMTCFGTPLYPRPFDEREVAALWEPFNVLAPLQFLQSGNLPEGRGVMLGNCRRHD